MNLRSAADGTTATCWLTLLDFTQNTGLLAHRCQAYRGMSLPPSITNQENAPQTCLQANMEAIPQLILPLPMILACVKLTKNNKFNEHSE